MERPEAVSAQDTNHVQWETLTGQTARTILHL